MALCTADATFTLPQWFDLCRQEPKRARLLLRTACDSVPARSVTLAETKQRIVKLQSCLACHCGATFHSQSAFSVHQAKKHAILPVVGLFADESYTCLACLLHFSTRQGLINHLQYGSRLCLLNTLLRVQPMGNDEHLRIRSEAQALKLQKVHVGIHQHAVDFPAYRLQGPHWQLLSLEGNFIHHSDPRHPAGPGKQKRIQSTLY